MTQEEAWGAIKKERSQSSRCSQWYVVMFFIQRKPPACLRVCWEHYIMLGMSKEVRPPGKEELSFIDRKHYWWGREKCQILIVIWQTEQTHSLCHHFACQIHKPPAVKRKRSNSHTLMSSSKRQQTVWFWSSNPTSQTDRLITSIIRLFWDFFVILKSNHIPQKLAIKLN